MKENGKKQHLAEGEAQVSIEVQQIFGLPSACFGANFAHQSCPFSGWNDWAFVCCLLNHEMWATQVRAWPWKRLVSIAEADLEGTEGADSWKLSADTLLSRAVSFSLKGICVLHLCVYHKGAEFPVLTCSGFLSIQMGSIKYSSVFTIQHSPLSWMDFHVLQPNIPDQHSGSQLLYL